MCRHALARLGAFPTLYDLPQLEERDTVSPHIDERAHYGTHHIAQEAVGRDDKPVVMVVDSLPFGPAHLAQRGLHVGMGLAECAEVGVSGEHPSRLVHQVEIELVMNEARMLPDEGVFPGVDIIIVGACFRAEPRMHVGRHLAHRSHTDVARKQSVEFIAELVAVYGQVGVEMRGHIYGMHPRVGTSGPHHLDGLSEQDGERFLQFSLHGVAVGLNLPSVVVLAIVAEENEISFAHCGGKVTKSREENEKILFFSFPETE